MSPASYRAAPPRVGGLSLEAAPLLNQNVYRFCAATAAAMAAFKRS